MASVVEEHNAAQQPNLAAWLPLVILPVVVTLLAAEWPSWVFMWVLAGAIYGGLKWLTFANRSTADGYMLRRSLAYLLLWPGMDVKSFFASSQIVERPLLTEWLFAIAKSVLGVVLFVVAADIVNTHPLPAAWLGMTGVAFALHFGLFHVLSVIWRQAGIDAKPIMRAPILSTSVSDYWGNRWNLAFRDWAHAYVFRPSLRRLGGAGATMAVFLASGLIHDVVMSVPAQAGFGLPTLYFQIQGIGLLLERSSVGKRLGAGKGLTGRLYCAAVVVGPILFLLHPPFVERVVIPMLAALGGA